MAKLELNIPEEFINSLMTTDGMLPRLIIGDATMAAILTTAVAKSTEEAAREVRNGFRDVWDAPTAPTADTMNDLTSSAMTLCHLASALFLTMSGLQVALEDDRKTTEETDTVTDSDDTELCQCPRHRLARGESISPIMPDSALPSVLVDMIKGLYN